MLPAPPVLVTGADCIWGAAACTGALKVVAVHREAEGDGWLALESSSTKEEMRIATLEKHRLVLTTQGAKPDFPEADVDETSGEPEQKKEKRAESKGPM